VSALRLYYLTVYLGLGAVLPLLALSMQSRGFRPSEYAWLMATLPMSRLLAPPLWGALADKWVGTALLLRVNTFVSAAAMAALSQRLSFSLTVLAFVVWAFFSSSLMPLAEAGTYRLLGSQAASFAHVRVFGSIGFGLSALLVGVVGVGADLSAAFWGGAAGYLIAGLISQAMPAGHGAAAKTPIWGAVLTLARRRDVLLLWLGSTLYYVAHGAYDVYYGPHIRTIAGVTDRTVSLAWALGVVAEIVLILFVPRLLRGRASQHLLVASAVVSTLRWWFLAHATSVGEVWLLQPLHAITFGLWYLVFVHENQEGTPFALRATVQGLSAACLGLGMISATLLGGYVLEHFGGRALFTCASVSAACSALLYALRAYARAVPAPDLLADGPSQP